MNKPAPTADRHGDVLDALHADSLGPGAASPAFDVEAMLDAIRRQAASFWESLSRREQHEFAVRAVERTLPAGARLMEEGDAADHVLVIREGRATILVRDQDGRERIVAERGPGELIGEHAIHQPGLRSATVLARTQVRAMVMKAEDFGEFLHTHPTVPRPPAKPT
jgi:CRP-like cAMP-binding protein